MAKGKRKNKKSEGGEDKPKEFQCANGKCKQILVTPPAEELIGRIVKVVCTACQKENYLQYHCWACKTPLDGIDYKKRGVQGQCPECKAYNPAKPVRDKDSCDEASNRCIDRIMFGFTACIQPYCVYSQLVWIYPYVLENMDMRGSALEKILYAITLFVSAGTLFNYWAGVFTKVPRRKVPQRKDVYIKSVKDSDDRMDVAGWQFCDACRAPRAPRDHHCSTCHTCVPIMDHHCPFYGGSCVGRHNHRNFILFLLYMMITTTWLSTTTVAFFPYLPGFPKWIFQRDFSKKIMAECRGASPLCPLMYIWSFDDVSMFGVVFIQLLLTILTLVLVSVLFQQQVSDLMESRTRLEGMIAKKKANKAKKNADGQSEDDKSEDDKSKDDEGKASRQIQPIEDAEATKWGELRDVCGPGHGLLSWVLTPKVGTLKSRIPVKEKQQ